MNTDTILKIGTIFISNISLCIALIIAVGNDVFPHPRLICGGLFFFFGLVAGYFIFLANIGWEYIIGIILLNALLWLIVYFQTRNRDIRGISIGQKTFVYLSKVDEGICFVADRVSRSHNLDEIEQSIKNSLTSILTQIGDLLDLNTSRGAQLSIFRAIKGRFIVSSEIGLSVDQVGFIEKNFSYKKPILGLAGHALHDRITIGIKNLSNSKDPNHDKWEPTFKGEPRKGSILCVSILRGINGSDRRTPMGTLNVATPQKGLLATPSVRSLLNRYADKIEILLYCLEMVEAKRG